MAKFNCPRCETLMAKRGFRTFSDGTRKQRYYCRSCHHRCAGEEVSTVFYEKAVSDYYKARPLYSPDITFKPQQFSKQQLQFMDSDCDCDCDSVFFNFLGCVIHSPSEFVSYVSKVPSDVYQLDGSFCQLHDAYFKR